MHRLHAVLGTAALSVVGVLATTSNAFAQDPAAPAPAAAKPAEAPQKTEDAEKKTWSIEANPVGLAVGHYSLQVEYSPATHHAIILNPVYTNLSMKSNDVDLGSVSGFGGELGYRYYTGSKGFNGFYIGPSVLFSAYTATPPDALAKAGAQDKSFTAIGGALDIGGQAVIGPGIVVGGGFGLQYTSTSEDVFKDMKDLNLAAVTVSGGVKPRLLFSLGYAF